MTIYKHILNEFKGPRLESRKRNDECYSTMDVSLTVGTQRVKALSTKTEFPNTLGVRRELTSTRYPLTSTQVHTPTHTHVSTQPNGLLKSW